jgi:dCTP deaminase
MLLSDRDIVRYMRMGQIEIRPLHEDAMQPASIDLRLGSKFKTFKGNTSIMGGIQQHFTPQFNILDPEQPPDMDEFDWAGIDGPFLLYPQMFALARTEEFISLGDRMGGRLEGKSSLGRLGLFIHSTAGFFDPGFKGTATLELFNGAPWPIRLRPGMKIAQMSFNPCASPALKPYGHPDLGSKYQGQIDPEASRYHLNASS